MSEQAYQSNSIQDQDSQHSVLFAQLLFQLSNTAMVLMGKVTDPDGGKPVEDLDAARLFVDQIEMLEAKTKGNLNSEETSLLKQTLMTLRMAFVQAVEAAEKRAEKPKPAEAPSTPTGQGETAQSPASGPTEEEHRKKFSKKY
jgi:hypothetical protein